MTSHLWKNLYDRFGKKTLCLLRFLLVFLPIHHLQCFIEKYIYKSTTGKGK